MTKNNDAQLETSPQRSFEPNSFGHSWDMTILDKGLFVVIAGAIGYFLGWRYLYSYFGAFGLDPSLLIFSPTEIISAGWRMYVAIATALLLGAVAFLASRRLSRYWCDQRYCRRAVILFLVSLLAGVLLLAVITFLIFFGPGVHIYLWFHVLTFIGILFVWLAFAFAIGIQSSDHFQQYTSRQIRSLVDWLMFDYRLWTAAILLYLTVALALFSGWIGFTYSLRDRSSASRLQAVTIFSNEELDMPAGTEIRSGVWAYDKLRLLYRSTELNVVFRLSEIGPNNETTLYLIPNSAVVDMHMESWAQQ